MNRILELTRLLDSFALSEEELESELDIQPLFIGVSVVNGLAHKPKHGRRPRGFVVSRAQVQEPLAVVEDGIIPLLSAGVIEAGDLIAINSDGRAIKFDDEDIIACGVAKTDATAGDIFSARVSDIVRDTNWTEEALLWGAGIYELSALSFDGDILIFDD